MRDYGAVSPLWFFRPMVGWIQRQAGQVATHHNSTLFNALLMTVVAQLAKRLPIARIPEQCLVTFVRHNVVNH